MSERALKITLRSLLSAHDLAGVLLLLERFSPRQLLNPLIGSLCNLDELSKWLAVTALGRVVAKLADQELEAGRVVMRRFMWMLNDESGGIGWGVPEAMGEVMACHGGLAEEFHQVLVAQMREDGNYLELEMLQRGLLWGVGRLAGVRPELLRQREAPRYLLPYLDSRDPEVRGRAVWALGRLTVEEVRETLVGLTDDPGPVTIYAEGMLTNHTVGELAIQALTEPA
ncbi:MAG TPA: HEAT repeat domain-containing protein [Desulfurivibrionaceae bacterium]|nr:HEAT repeat domain-containing protein [Desulfurivibrionaceae bacterium]